VIRFKKPISFLTTGQKVPEDIEMATKERLVDLLLNISGS
jgi:flagellar biosynthesis GTPase FlhF